MRVTPLTRRSAHNYLYGNIDLLEKMFNRQSLTNAACRLLRTEQVEKVIERGKVRIKITPKGLKVLAKSLDLEKFSRRNWDKKWRLVVFDVREKSRIQRNLLRRKLKSLGLGMLQKSVWLCPLPIEDELNEFFSTLRIRGEVLVCRAEILVGDQREIANRVWNLNKIKKRYLKLIDWWGLKKKGKTEKNKVDAYQFQQSYFSILSDDPFLPRELLAKDWPTDRVKTSYLSQVAPLLNE